MTAQELRDRLKNDLNIVEKFLDVARRNEINLKSDLSFKGELSAVHLPAPYGIIGPAVANAIKQCGKKYDVRDIRKRLIKDGKDISTGRIATALRRFERQGKIKEVEHGSGRRPNKYATISL